MKRIVILIAVLVAASLACSGLSAVIPTELPTLPPVIVIPTGLPTTLPTLPPIIVQPQSNVLFSDDFSDSSSGWDQLNDVDKITDYASGGYRMWLNKTSYDI